MNNTDLSVFLVEKKSNKRLGRRELFFSTTNSVNKTLDTNKKQKRFAILLKFYRQRNTSRRTKVISFGTLLNEQKLQFEYNTFLNKFLT